MYNLGMMNEQDYIRGRRAAWLMMLRTCLQEFGVNDPESRRVQWVLEREQTIAALREACEHHGDNEWDEDLHLADVVEKHLMKHLGA